VGILVLGGIVVIAFRILFDFSGYSDIAIGTAKLFGVDLPENFNWPYLARNIQDFWQRWHISLSSWIRDYIYIPLGGSSHGPVRRVTNGLIAFGLAAPQIRASPVAGEGPAGARRADHAGTRARQSPAKRRSGSRDCHGRPAYR
jgi:hypothetical protein